MTVVPDDVMSIGRSVDCLGREIMAISAESHPLLGGGLTARMTSHGCCQLMTVVPGDVMSICRSVACLGREIMTISAD